jgi:DNA-binding FadR family transcriptional regulator
VLYRLSQLLRRPIHAEGVRVEQELPDVARHEYETHYRLYVAIRDHDEQRAQALMREHLEIAHGWEDEIASLRAVRLGERNEMEPCTAARREPAPEGAR